MFWLTRKYHTACSGNGSLLIVPMDDKQDVNGTPTPPSLTSRSCSPSLTSRSRSPSLTSRSRSPSLTSRSQAQSLSPATSPVPGRGHYRGRARGHNSRSRGGSGRGRAVLVEKCVLTHHFQNCRATTWLNCTV